MRIILAFAAVFASLFAVGSQVTHAGLVHATTCNRYDAINSGNVPAYDNPNGYPVYSDLVAYYCSDNTEYFVLAVGPSGYTTNVTNSRFHIRVWICGYAQQNDDTILGPAMHDPTGGDGRGGQYYVSPVYADYGCGIQADDAYSTTVAGDGGVGSRPPGGYAPYVHF